MVYFCTDLDNTLIHSYKHEMGADKVLVERMDGRELSYMSREAYEILEKISGVGPIIPITTRSLQQYSRINLGETVKIPYALAANGGVLLEHGKTNETWYEESKQLIQASGVELERAMRLLETDSRIVLSPRLVDGLFLFAKSSECEATKQILKDSLNPELVDVESNGMKIYVLPKKLNKGEALARLRTYIGGQGFFIAAGDSRFDIGMLKEADLGLCPEELMFESEGSVIRFAKGEFTERMLKEVWSRYTPIFTDEK